MSHGRSSRALQIVEDYYAEIPHATKIILVDHTAYTTVLGPVPRGRVYRVFDVNATNSSTTTHIFSMRQVKDNGSGFAFGFRPVSLLLGASARLPESYVAIGATNTDHMKPWTFVMEFNDILQVQLDVAWSIAQPRVRCSYWEARA